MRSPAGTCSVASCDRPASVRGYCHAHYQRVLKHGDPQGGKPLREHGQSLEERFWSKVDKSGGCWLWTAAITRATGYGRFGVGGDVESAHRVAYELVNGPIPDGLQIDHLCRVRACVRPDHLEVVSHAENIRRGDWSARAAAFQQAKTHCRRGHPFDDSNTSIDSRGNRRCRACGNENMRRYYQQAKAEGRVGQRGKITPKSAVMRTMAVLLVAGLLLLGGCGDDDNGGSPSPGGKQTWEQFVRENGNGATRRADFDGHKVWVSEADRTVYIEDCAAAQRSTKQDGPFPSYGYACDAKR